MKRDFFWIFISPQIQGFLLLLVVANRSSLPGGPVSLQAEPERKAGTELYYSFNLNHMNINDWIGFIGVAILLLAFLLNLMGKISQQALPYILMNITGAALAGLASYLIHYIPFVILEGTWMVVSVGALLRYLRTKD
jgi:hypothetical protein